MREEPRINPILRSVGAIPLLLAAFMCATLQLRAAGAEGMRLERVVLVSRHGIRAPLRSNRIFRDLTRRGWPNWPGGAGEMTPHGADALAAMADYLRAVYTDAGLLPRGSCPVDGSLFVWADAADRRTRQSGTIWATRLAPGCGITAGSSARLPDPVFDSGKSGACRIGPVTAASSLWRASTPADLLTPPVRTALDRLQAIVAPRGCGLPGGGICLKPGPGDGRLRVAAKLALGGLTAEAIYLQYVEGFPPDQVGWGRAGDEAAIAAITPAHDEDLDLRKRTPLVAARHGAVLARAILSLLDGKDPPGSPHVPAAAKLIMFAGHDSNLLYLAGVMGLDWRFPHQPSMTAPDTVLAFEVWRDPATGTRAVRIRAFAQSLDQLRRALPLDAAHPPDSVPVVPAACASSACTPERLRQGVEANLRKVCE